MLFAVEHEVFRAAALGETCFKQAAEWIKTPRALTCLIDAGIPKDEAIRLQKTLDCESMYNMHRVWGPHAMSSLMAFDGELTDRAVKLLLIVYPVVPEGHERGLIQPGCYYGFFFLLFLLYQATVMHQSGVTGCNTDYTVLITKLLGAWPATVTKIPEMMHKRYNITHLSTAASAATQLVSKEYTISQCHSATATRTATQPMQLLSNRCCLCVLLSYWCL